MTNTTPNIDELIDEYRTLVAESSPIDDTCDLTDRTDWVLLAAALVRSGSWTPGGAQAVAMLARQYGVFMLRNALALAYAAEIEDGELGF